MDASGAVGIALIGDHDPAVTAHRAIPPALAAASHTAGIDVRPTWIHTASIPDPIDDFLAPYNAIWCIPATPYASMTGALRAIRYARESGTPFLGTCGGFQHAVIEYARNALGLSGAGHAETDPGAADPIVTPLSCTLVERAGTIELLAGSQARALCGTAELREEFHCCYGLNAAYEDRLERQGLRITGRDPAGEARVVELAEHPFFLATLFQPERAGLRGESHPLIAAFVAAAASFKLHREGAWTTSVIPSGISSTPGR
ncbi:MAG: CTP synthase C-terminal region-related (seleno)protein [Gemmatimonadales bacterium]